MSYADEYTRELLELAGRVHARNARLVTVALKGLRAGRRTDDMLAEIIAAGGEPPLTEAEVTRAIESAERIFVPAQKSFYKGSFSGERTFTVPKRPSLTGPNAKERGFVREMMAAGKGTTSKDFFALSAFDPTRATPAECAVAFLKRIFKPGELVFMGDLYTPRTRENLKTLEERIAQISHVEAPLAPFVMPNPFTGAVGTNSAGKASYCLDSTVVHRRMALVEFDDLPLTSQAEFWMGVIRTGLLPVRTLVFSGNKSIHGLVELTESATWEAQWRTLERVLCSDADAAYHADRACKNASRATRLPGAYRPDTRQYQVLLYLAEV